MNTAKKYEERNGLSLFVPEVTEHELRHRALRTKVVQNFDKEKIMVKNAAGEFNQYDRIQEGLGDTEIYTVLSRYNCTVDEAKERMKSNLKEIHGIFDMDTKFVDVVQANLKAEEQFNLLPLDVRDKFGNSVERFLKEGKSYIEEEIKKQNELKNPIINNPIKAEEGEVENV